MKTFFLLYVMFLASLSVSAQDVTGKWYGNLKVPGGITLRLIFNVSNINNAYSASLYSPDQGTKEIPVTHTTFNHPTITFEVTNLKIKYVGNIQGDSIVGTFNQGGQGLPLNLTRQSNNTANLKKPQEPTPPYSYYSEDVHFENEHAHISLAGTLTLPKKDGNYPVVILITGSGPQNRDEMVLGHKPFLVIADYLTKNGMGVLRFDDRGVAQSTGDFKTATTADFATDVESAITYLKTRKEINVDKIGLIGHSEGGIIAPMVASRSKDVAFIVLLAGTGIRGDKLLLLQQALVARADGASETDIEKTVRSNSKVFKTVIKSKNELQLKHDLSTQIQHVLDKDSSILPEGMTKAAYLNKQVNDITAPWIQYFIRYNPAIALQKLTCPVLVLNGEKDLQVPAKENVNAIKKALRKGGNKKVTAIIFPNLNHFFQECKTGAPSEYGTIEQTFSPTVLAAMGTWIHTQIQ